MMVVHAKAAWIVLLIDFLAQLLSVEWTQPHKLWPDRHSSTTQCRCVVDGRELDAQVRLMPRKAGPLKRRFR